MRKLFTHLGLLALLGFVSFTQALAQSDRDTIEDEAWEAAYEVDISGPADIKILDQAILHIKKDQLFVPKAEADRLVVSWGNTSNPKLEGVILPLDDSEDWVVTVDQIKDGFVSDAEAKNWNPDDLLAPIISGTNADNEVRIARGFTPIEIVGWQQLPTYDDKTHKLIWSLKSQSKGANPTDTKAINYSTYALGRDGYFKLELVTDEKVFEREKTIAQAILANFNYNIGKRYTDYNANTDKLAAYGIVALIIGLAAQKIGIPPTLPSIPFDYSTLFTIAFIALISCLITFRLFRKNPKE